MIIVNINFWRLIMDFFTSNFFWFIEGIFLCLTILGLKTYMEDREIPMPFWKWILSIFWLFAFGFVIAFIGTSIGENEMTAAIKGGVIFGLCVIVTGVGLWRLLLIRPKL